MLGNIESKNEQQNHLIAKLFQQQEEMFSNLQEEAKLLGDLEEMSASSRKKKKLAANDYQWENPAQTNFADSFGKFLSSANTISDDDLSKTIKRAVRMTPNKLKDAVGELFVHIEQVKTTIPIQQGKVGLNNNNSDQRACSCVDCPHLRELKNIDQFHTGTVLLLWLICYLFLIY